MSIHTLLRAAVISTLMILPFVGSSQSETSMDSSSAADATSSLVTFIELGSVKCIPCRMMQPVMNELEENFPSDLRMLFYDIWTDEQSHYAREYGVRVIPTQVFLDQDGNEFFRHEGFFPYEQIVDVLSRQGVKR